MNVLRFVFVGASIALSPALSFAQAPSPVAPPPPVAPLSAPPAASPPSYGSPPPSYAPYGQPPPYMAPLPPQTRMVRHSGALMGGGIALTAIGVLSGIGAATAFVGDATQAGGSQGYLTLFIGLPLAIHGLGCIAGGIPMIVIGNRKIPVEIPRMMPTVVSSRGGTGLGWKF